MKTPHLLVAVTASALYGFTGVQPASAELPSLNEQPWFGYFAVSENKRCKFTVTAQGKAAIVPMNDKGKPVGKALEIPVTFGVEEILPGGKTRMKELNVASLESTDPATDELEKTVIRGKVTGDAAFELNIEQDRGMISIGGRITDSGTLTKNPIRFTVRMKIPNAYANEKKEDKKQLKAFGKKIRNDRLDLKWTDGKRYKQTFESPVDVASKEINGPGIASAEIEISAYDGKKLLLNASANSAITLSGGGKPAPLHEGFSLNWLSDAAKDPEGKARLSFQVK